MLNCHKIIYDESGGYKIFIIFFFLFVQESKIKQGEQHTYFLCLLLPLLLPNNDGEEVDCERFSCSSEQNFILLHASESLSNLYLI